MTDLRLSDARIDAAVPVGAVRGALETAAPAGDLPLFGGADDAPLVTPPAVPRPPLAVRRAAPVVTRPRARREDADLEPELDLDAPPEEARPRAASVRATSIAEPVHAATTTDAAPAGSRLMAAAIDTLLMGSIDVAVVYFSLQICGLELTEIRALPPVPLIAFLLLLNGGYAAIFTTAGGQTLGKMASGIRVVQFAGGPPGRVPFGQAVVRSAAYFVSLLPAGLGFLFALFSADGRALHDKIAETRVIRA